MDKRNSKSTLLKEIEKLRIKVEVVYEAGYEGIHYVGAANYPEREFEAIEKLNDAFYD